MLFTNIRIQMDISHSLGMFHEHFSPKYTAINDCLSFPPPRNFRLADLVTIMNGVCGSFSIFSSARYLLTNDMDYLWSALAFPLAGLMFDFLDGKVARWRKSSSMLGQELDSLADLVR
jgi:phosphatidylserine synthase